MNQTQLLDLLNNASREDLVALPGIGPTLAERILAARPFDSLEAVQAVKGVGVSLLERLSDVEPEAPQVEAESRLAEIKENIAETGQAVGQDLSDLGKNISEKGQAVRQAIGQGLAEWGESAKKGGQAARQAIEALPQKLEQTARTRGPLWTTLVAGALTALVTVLLTLAVLGGINGSLKYATGSQYRTMQNEISQLSTQAETLRQDLDGLRTRVDTLEGLGERTVALEKAQQQLAADLKAAGEQVAGLNEQVTQQEERTQRFETFLKDLQTLLGNLFAPQGETK